MAEEPSSEAVEDISAVDDSSCADDELVESSSCADDGGDVLGESSAQDLSSEVPKLGPQHAVLASDADCTLGENVAEGEIIMRQSGFSSPARTVEDIPEGGKVSPVIARSLDLFGDATDVMRNEHSDLANPPAQGFGVSSQATFPGAKLRTRSKKMYTPAHDDGVKHVSIPARVTPRVWTGVCGAAVGPRCVRHLIPPSGAPSPCGPSPTPPPEVTIAPSPPIGLVPRGRCFRQGLLSLPTSPRPQVATPPKLSVGMNEPPKVLLPPLPTAASTASRTDKIPTHLLPTRPWLKEPTVTSPREKRGSFQEHIACQKSGSSSLATPVVNPQACDHSLRLWRVLDDGDLPAKPKRPRAAAEVLDNCSQPSWKARAADNSEAQSTRGYGVRDPAATASNAASAGDPEAGKSRSNFNAAAPRGVAYKPQLAEAFKPSKGTFDPFGGDDTFGWTHLPQGRKSLAAARSL